MLGKFTFNIDAGTKFGRLTAIERAPGSKWLFQCDCGVVSTINRYDVINGKTKSCGCSKVQSIQETRKQNITERIIGKKFNGLTVIEFSHRKNGKTYWKCRCDCGSGPIIVLGNIVTGSARSCGCLRTHKYPSGDSGLKSLYFKYRKSAKREGHVFELSLEEFKKITSLNCTYCGRPPNKTEAAITKKQTIRDYTSYLYNGIDRIDSSKGYEKDNVTPCCRWCNIIKRERSVDELKAHINRIVGHLKLCED